MEKKINNSNLSQVIWPNMQTWKSLKQTDCQLQLQCHNFIKEIEWKETPKSTII